MALSQNLATIRPSDCERLNLASEHLAAVAATIQSTRANYAPSCVALIIEVNEIVLGLRDRGLRRIRMWAEKQQDKLDQAAREKQAATDATGEEQLALPSWPTNPPGASE